MFPTNASYIPKFKSMFILETFFSYYRGGVHIPLRETFYLQNNFEFFR